MIAEIKTLAEAQRFFLQYSPPKMAGETYTLGRMVQLMDFLGNPQNSYKVIHIAGTSGKTSTAYFVRALLEQAGCKVGLTISPHITSIAERVQLHGQPLDEPKFVAYVNEFIAAIQPSELQMTYFELLMAFAYWVFAKEKVEYAVIETGLGGLLDASNVVTRADKLCVITPIGLDHTDVLGDTLEAIATQKAGIIGANQQVFSTVQAESAVVALDAAAHEQNTHIQYIADSNNEPAILPRFQRQNWQLATNVYNALVVQNGLPQLSKAQLESAMRATPPGRFERYNIAGISVLLDGAHNAQKLASLIASLPHEFTAESTWLAAFVQAPDTKIQACVDEIAACNIAQIICTEFTVGQDIKGRQSIPARQLEELSRAKGISATAQSDVHVALQQALQTKRPVVITGSLYLVSAVRPLLVAMKQEQLV